MIGKLRFELCSAVHKNKQNFLFGVHRGERMPWISQNTVPRIPPADYGVFAISGQPHVLVTTLCSFVVMNPCLVTGDNSTEKYFSFLGIMSIMTSGKFPNGRSFDQ